MAFRLFLLYLLCVYLRPLEQFAPELMALRPMLVPMATPLRMPVTELEPPRWQEITRSGAPGSSLGPAW